MCFRSWCPSARAQWLRLQAWLLCGMWDLPRSGIDPMSPPLAGGFFATEPPEKPWNFTAKSIIFSDYLKLLLLMTLPVFSFLLIIGALPAKHMKYLSDLSLLNLWTVTKALGLPVVSCSSAPKPRLCRVRLLGKDFPGRTVDKALPANAGHTGRPWSGKAAHAAEQLSLRSSAGRDAATVGSLGTPVKSSLYLPWFGKARVRQGRPRVTKIK